MLRPSDTLYWASGDYQIIAVVHLPGGDLENAAGIEVKSGNEDGLGRWEGVGGTLDTGIQIELVCYPDSSAPEAYEVRVDAGLDSRLRPALLDEVLVALHLDHGDVIWVNDSSESI